MYFLTVSACLLACAFAAPPSNPQLAGKLLGGNETTLGQFPYQASLQFKSGGILFVHVCNAAIISSSWSLTAAQCRDSFDLSKYRLVGGLINYVEIGQDAQITGIQEFILHPNYHGGHGLNDIALLFHSIPFTWNNVVQPVKLPLGATELTGDAILTAWGNAKVLYWATLPLITHEECKSKIGSLDGSQVCTGVNAVRAAGCQENRGGSLVQNGAVVGILSWTFDGFCADPAVYTRVDGHTDFILQHVDDLSF